MKYITLKGKVILTKDQEKLIKLWHKVLHSQWNKCVELFEKKQILTKQKYWYTQALTTLTADHRGKAKTKLKQDIEAAFNDGPNVLHHWDFACHQTSGKDGKIQKKFYLCCRLKTAKGVKSIHEPRNKKSDQNPLVEFYHYKHELLTPFICSLQPHENDKKAHYSKAVRLVREEHKFGHLLNTRYENGLVKRFNSAVSLFIQDMKRNSPPKFKSYKDPLDWLFTYQSDQINLKTQGIALPGVKELGVLVDQNSNLRDRLKGYKDISLRSASLNKEHDGYYLTLTIGYEENSKKLEFDPNSIVGIDLGVVHHHVTSDGRYFGSKDLHNLKAKKRQNKKLFNLRKVEKLQRKQSKCVFRSKSWYRLKDDIAKKRSIAARQHSSWQEYHTTQLANHYDVVVAESLNLNSMKLSAKGKLGENGNWVKNNAAAKSGLNRSLSASAPGRALEMLKRKCKVFIKVNPVRTSQECSKCGHTDPKNRTTQSLFVCGNCGHTENADFNASKNIENRGKKALDAWLNGENWGDAEIYYMGELQIYLE